MGLNTLNPAHSNGEVIDASDVNDITAAITESFVGRNAEGVPAPNRSLGTQALPWGNLYAKGIVINNKAVDVSKVLVSPNRIVSGPTRARSIAPDFLQGEKITKTGDKTGTGAVTIKEGLTLSIAGETVVIDKPITIPFNVGVINSEILQSSDYPLIDPYDDSRFAGEHDNTKWPTYNFSPECTELELGKYYAVKKATTRAEKTDIEVFIGVPYNQKTSLSNCYRGFFSPRVACGSADNVEFLEMGYIFIDADKVSNEITTIQPTYSTQQPQPKGEGHYWFDMNSDTWYRYSGSIWTIVKRIPVGMVTGFVDGIGIFANVLTRCIDYAVNSTGINTIKLRADKPEAETNTILITDVKENIVEVYGQRVTLSEELAWNITQDLDIDVNIADMTTQLWLYVTTEGRPVISDQKPYYRNDLIGLYHPYESWRAIGMAKTNLQSEFLTADSYCVTYEQANVDLDNLTEAGYSTIVNATELDWDKKEQLSSTFHVERRGVVILVCITQSANSSATINGVTVGRGEFYGGGWRNNMSVWADVYKGDVVTYSGSGFSTTLFVPTKK